MDNYHEHNTSLPNQISPNALPETMAEVNRQRVAIGIDPIPDGTALTAKVAEKMLDDIARGLAVQAWYKNLCNTCLKDFNSVSAFDAHRVTDETGKRRCLSTEEMIDKGMAQNQLGRWCKELFAEGESRVSS